MLNNMERNEEGDGAEIINMIGKMSEKKQYAFIWMIENFKLVRKMCENLDLTDAEVKKFKEKAIAKEDYLTYLLLCAVETFNHRCT